MTCFLFYKYGLIFLLIRFLCCFLVIYLIFLTLKIKVLDTTVMSDEAITNTPMNTGINPRIDNGRVIAL